MDIAAYARTKDKKMLQHTNVQYIHLSIDETTDVSCFGNLQIIASFELPFTNELQAASDIFMLVSEVLSDYEIPWSKVLSICTDDASNLTGRLHSACATDCILSDQKLQMSHLSSTFLLSCESLPHTLDTVQSVGTHSQVCMQKLKRAQLASLVEADTMADDTTYDARSAGVLETDGEPQTCGHVEGELRKIPTMGATRWLSIVRSSAAILHNYPVLVEHFHEEKKTVRNHARGIEVPED
ncbi:hypothetical protein ACHHYP_20729 [Achlya hypogyna]|uniref:Uncharacterized protein n=1 Tax=Achlya hypogyna TaxID=1202772 RepID=A0A1V9YD91_ACHHY|nr:hypothetical protein ACHHYP_20729 [Achlya hypogyna]